MTDPHATLAELVTRRPGLAATLEHHGLDYCCGGDRTLGDACAVAGLDLQSVAAELDAVPEPTRPPEWTHLGPSDLVDHLEATHHRYLREELPRLAALLDRVVDVHGARHPELAGVRDRFVALRAELEPHLFKEERILFPMIRELAAAAGLPAFHCGSLANPIGVMRHEHDTAAELLAELRALTDGYAVPADGCASYRAAYPALGALESDTHLHVHKENNVLFPAVLRLEASLASTAS